MTRFTLKPLPYPQDALAPVMSGRTVQIHHGRFQVGYVETLNRLLHDTSHEHEDLELIILHTRSEPKARPVYNCASQLWNHEFFWESLAPDHAGEPPRTVARELVSAFGSVDVFRGQMVETARHHFGSGWLWLSMSPSGALGIDATHDAESPLLWGARPLFACDLWEHAYYLDYEQDRAQYVEAVVDRLINWECLAARLDASRHRPAAADYMTAKAPGASQRTAHSHG